MKLNFTRAFAILSVSAVLLYSSCTKSALKPVTAPATISNATAQQIAMSIYMSLTGQMGGANVKDGVQAPASITPASSGKSLNSLSSPLCGYMIDTSYFQSGTSLDTNRYLFAKYDFTYTCSGNAGVDGYTLYDSVRTQAFNSTFEADYTNVQQYIFQEVGQSYTEASVYGSIKTSTSFSVTGTGEYHTLYCDYTLNKLYVTNGPQGTDIIGGSATFTSQTHDIDSATGPAGSIINYTGNIVFKGNYEAVITIDPGHKYLVNMITKVITPE
jgi:hypothetical protein